jgi:hypothetical protein
MAWAISAHADRDRKRLEREAAEYAAQFIAEEDTCKFVIGCSEHRTNRAFMWRIEAARLLAGGDRGNGTAIKLLKLALKEVQAAQPGACMICGYAAMRGYDFSPFGQNGRNARKKVCHFCLD